jgi:hypothetical protein
MNPMAESSFPEIHSMSSTHTASTGSGTVPSLSSPDSLGVTGNSPMQLTGDSLPPRRPTFATTFLHDFGTDAEEDTSNFKCSYCAQLDLEAILLIVNELSTELTYPLPSSKELWKSSVAGCWGCRFFWHVIENDLPHHHDRPPPSFHDRKILSDTMIKVLKQQDLSICLEHSKDYFNRRSASLTVYFPAEFLHGTESSDVLDDSSSPKSLTISFYLLLRITKFALFDSSPTTISKIGSYSTRHLLAPNANTPECQDLIRSWLRECSTIHILYCGRMTDKPLPARIIVVPRDVRLPIKLKSTCAGEVGRYVTLSHCWGSGIDFVATSTNITSLEKEIPVQNLCTNFQDAITVTRDQGFQYLWIDALCILQDSRQEWAEQSALMAQIYQRSAFMISAAAATQPQDGFLRNRPLDVARSPKFGKLNDMILETTQWYKGNSDIAAINKRAWCYQEHIMAPRIVHFEESRLSWECNAQRWSEDNGKHAQRLRHGSDDKSRISLFLKPDDGKIFLPSAEKSSARSLNESANSRMGAWYLTQLVYSRRSLTVPTDRFPAISGIAAILRTQEMGQYLAGIWEKSFFEGLSWYTFGSDRYDEYIAPTWSWASIKGGTYRPGDCFPVIREEPFFAIWKTDFGPQLVDRDIKLITQNPYGQIAPGSSVTIEGFCCEITTCFIQNARRPIFARPAYFEWPVSEGRSWSFASEDGRAILQDRPFNPSAPARQVTCLQIDYRITGGYLKQPTLVLLLIEPVEADHACFRRVGILFVGNKELIPESPLWDALLAKELWQRRTIKLI